MLENPSTTGGAPVDDVDLELAQVQAAKPAGEQVEPPAELPEKYRGKSVEDVAAMHMNLEREKSRLANELGEMRRVADKLINVKPVEENTRNERQPVTVEALLDNPDKALSSAFESSPVAVQAAQANQRVDELERRLGYEAFTRDHPNYTKDINDPAWVEWVKKNPARLELAARADKFDFNAANALWSMWDEHKQVTSNARTQERADDTATRAATVRAAPAATSVGTGPVYSRSKLMELRMRANSGDAVARAKLDDPAFNARLVQAYADGRVR